MDIDYKEKFKNCKTYEEFVSCLAEYITRKYPSYLIGYSDSKFLVKQICNKELTKKLLRSDKRILKANPKFIALFKAEMQKIYNEERLPDKKTTGIEAGIDGGFTGAMLGFLGILVKYGIGNTEKKYFIQTDDGKVPYNIGENFQQLSKNELPAHSDAFYANEQSLLNQMIPELEQKYNTDLSNVKHYEDLMSTLSDVYENSHEEERDIFGNVQDVVVVPGKEQLYVDMNHGLITQIERSFLNLHDQFCTGSWQREWLNSNPAYFTDSGQAIYYQTEPVQALVPTVENVMDCIITIGGLGLLGAVISTAIVTGPTLIKYEYYKYRTKQIIKRNSLKNSDLKLQEELSL